MKNMFEKIILMAIICLIAAPISSSLTFAGGPNGYDCKANENCRAFWHVLGDPCSVAPGGGITGSCSWCSGPGVIDACVEADVTDDCQIKAGRRNQVNCGAYHDGTCIADPMNPGKAKCRKNIASNGACTKNKC